MTLTLIVNGTAAIFTGWIGLVMHLRGDYRWAAIYSFMCGANAAMVGSETLKFLLGVR